MPYIYIERELGEEIWASEINFKVIRNNWVQECIGGKEIKIITVGSFVEKFMRKQRIKGQKLKSHN